MSLVLVIGKNALHERLTPRDIRLPIGRVVESRVQRIELARHDQLPDRQAAARQVGRIAAQDTRLELLVHARIAPEINMDAGMQPLVLAGHLLVPLDAVAALEDRYL